MPNTIFLVDLPNFYSRLLKSRSIDPKRLKDYFLHWLDFDLLANSLAQPHNGMWLFYSGERIGPSSERIEGRFLQDYVRRINALKGITAWDVNIPGEQREAISYKCENCGHTGIAQALSEKGIDASLTVHLFDTMDSWDIAYLLSGDADFVPAVASLRRRGKIVIGVGFPNASAALIQECYNYIDINEVYLTEDFLLYLIFRKDGIAKRWLTDEVISVDSPEPPAKIVFRVIWGLDSTFRAGIEYMGLLIRFVMNGQGDITERLSLINDLKAEFPDNVNFNYEKLSINIFIRSQNKEAINRNLKKLLESTDKINFNINPKGGSAMSVEYEFDRQENKYQSIGPRSKQTS